MLSTSSIPAPHLVQARAERRLLLERSDTIPAPCQGSSELRFSIVANARSAGRLRATKTDFPRVRTESPAAAVRALLKRAWIGNRPLDPPIFEQRAQRPPSSRLLVPTCH
jgi:hypothetical protein